MQANAIIAMRKSNGFARMTFALVETDLCVKATESVWTAIPLDNDSPGAARPGIQEFQNF